MADSLVIRQSDLLNQLVIDRSTMEELGRVEVLWTYPPAHRVLGFIGKAGLLGKQKFAFQLSQIDALGENGVLIHGRAEKTTAEKVRQLESLIDHEVWSDEGNRVGKITDFLLHLQTGEIKAYLLAASGWAGMLSSLYQLAPTQIISVGKRRVLISEAELPQLEVYQAGVSQKLIRVSESLKEDALEEWLSIAKRAEATTEQAKEQLQELTEQAKTQAQTFSQQLKRKTQTWNEQFRETSQTLLERVRDQGQTLVERVKAEAETLEERVEDWIEPLQPTAAPDAIEDWSDDWFDWPEVEQVQATPSAANISQPDYVQPEQVQPNQVQSNQAQPNQAQPVQPKPMTDPVKPDKTNQSHYAAQLNLSEDEDEPWI